MAAADRGYRLEIAAPQPSEQFLSARRILREQAIGRTEQRLRVSPDVMPAIRDAARAQLEPALGAVGARHAGWAGIGAGTLIARNAERLSAAGGDIEPDASFTAGLAWAGLIVAVVGDTVLEADAAGPEEPWSAGEPAADARRLAAEIAAADDGIHTLAGRRFSRYVIGEITSGMPELDAGQAGYTLATLAVWAGRHEQQITEPLTRRRRLGRRTLEPDGAQGGCAFCGSLLAQIGEALIERG